MSLCGAAGYLGATDPWLCVLVVLPAIALLRTVVGRESHAAARFDGKTGLLNAAAWEQLARRAVQRSRREVYPLAVLLIDLDRFKLINDRYGHLAGDAALRDVASALAGAVRSADAVGRFGGEEFAVLLPRAGRREAVRIAERLRARINDVHVRGQDGTPGVRLSASIGVACAPLDGVELLELMGAADVALYRAKERGRNRVEGASRRAGGTAERALSG